MKRFAGRASIVGGVAELAVLGGFLALPGCQVTVTDGTVDGVEEGLSGAWVEFPDDPDILMTIDEDDGIGSAVFYGYDTVDGEDVVVTRFEFDTGEGTATVSVDGEGRPTRVAIGSATLDMQYNVDGSFNFQLYENGQILFEDDYVTAEATTAKRSFPRTSRVVESDFVACVNGRMEAWAARTIARHGGLGGADSVPGHRFTDCLKNNEPLWNLARAYCVITQRALERVKELWQELAEWGQMLERIQEREDLDEQDRRNRDEIRREQRRMNSVVDAVLVFMARVQTGLDGSAAAVGRQLWGSQECGGDDVCGNGTCGANENATNCPADCGSPEVCGNGTCGSDESAANCPADCGSSEVCGNGICGTGESPANCPADCGPGTVCGNGVCESGEDTANCPADCGSSGQTGGSCDALGVLSFSVSAPQWDEWGCTCDVTITPTTSDRVVIAVHYIEEATGADLWRVLGVLPSVGLTLAQSELDTREIAAVYQSADCAALYQATGFDPQALRLNVERLENPCKGEP